MLQAFDRRRYLADWEAKGICYCNTVLIDNPLADPFDAELVGLHHLNKADITIKCVEKKDPEEKVGVLVKENGVTQIREYSELSEQERRARLENGQFNLETAVQDDKVMQDFDSESLLMGGDHSQKVKAPPIKSDYGSKDCVNLSSSTAVSRLKHRCANLSLFCFSLPFIKKADRLGYFATAPLHSAWKAAKYLDQEGIARQSDKPIAWKFETFIFDLLSLTEKNQAILYPREECFAPLKNAAGHNDPESVKMALQARDRSVFAAISGLKPPERPFELSPAFYYPTAELLAKWKGKPLPDTDYIN